MTQLLISLINKKNMSMGMIAAQFGMTRNAIIGKATRLKAGGIQLDTNPIGTNRQGLKRWRSAAAKKEFLERCEQINKKKFKAVTPSGAVREVTTNSRVGRIVNSVKPTVFFPAMADAVFSLQEDQCRWPIGEAGNFAFCPNKQFVGSYCCEHTALSFHCREVRVEA